MYMQGRQLDSWHEAHNAAEAPPFSPVITNAPLQTLILLPYGATELRLAEMPTVPK